MSESGKKKVEAKSKKEKLVNEAKINKKNCETSKQILADIEPHARIRMKMPDGSYKQLTFEERQEQIDKAKKNIEKFCK